MNCVVSTLGAEKDVSELSAQIKVRGNSTSWQPKKPYRIKLDKKASLFGYEKAKNWSLLADYMDASNMHNYTALEFAKMVRGESSFSVTPTHVNVIMNGQNIGLYIFCEHIDTKTGRIDIEQDRLWEKEFDQINFYIERDKSTIQDTTEIEDETYFVTEMENYPYENYVFSLKYPEKEDFEEELEDGTINSHETEFFAFFNQLKNYMQTICDTFVNYYNGESQFSAVSQLVDVQSLAMYGVIDQAFMETDHFANSFKMYRYNGGLLKFGPNWDYDACAYGFSGGVLPYQKEPFKRGSKTFTSTWFSELWGLSIFNDEENGRPLFKNIWDNISSSNIEDFINDQMDEIITVSEWSIKECEIWMNNEYYCLFDNQLYYYNWITVQLPYLKNLYN